MTKQPPDPRVELLSRLQTEVCDEAVDRVHAGYLMTACEVLALRRQWWRSDRRVAVRADAELKFRVVYPLAMHAMSSVDAALALLARPWVAAVNARVVFECALAAQWVLLTT